MELSKFDVELVEKCVTEKWNPIAMGCKSLFDMDQVGNCQLCGEYRSSGEFSCFNCPVSIFTGRKVCSRTPFASAVKILDEKGIYIRVWEKSEPEFRINIPMVSEIMVHVEAEIEFLINLLPADHPWRNI